ncbi:hypothetical protein B4U80_13467, partial [Leptotrombidium deliense]
YPPLEDKYLNSGFIEIGDHRPKVRDRVKDTIAMWSTSYGFRSYRRTKNGTRFVNALYNAISKYCYEKEITEILRIVQTESDNIDNYGSAQVTEMQLIGFEKHFYFPRSNVNQSSAKTDLKRYNYKISLKQIGLCMIFNMEKFKYKYLDERTGSSIDAKNLEMLFTRCWLEYGKYIINKQSPVRDIILTYGGGVNHATMREMLVGTRLAEYIFHNAMFTKCNFVDAEIMDFIRMTSVVWDKVGLSAGPNMHAVGVRKFLFPLKFDKVFGDEAYDLSSNPRGFAISIGHSEIPSTVKDEYIRIVAEKLKFEIISEPRMTKRKLFEYIKKIKSDKRLKNHKAFILNIVGRVEGEIFYAKDNQQINMIHLIQMFNDDDCPYLSGKPKFIIFANDGYTTTREEYRTDEEILLCNDMEKIFDKTLDLRRYTGGCHVHYHTPFAVFEMINEYEKQIQYLHDTHVQFTDSVLKAMNNVTSIAGKSNMEKKFPFNKIYDDVERGLCKTEDDITPKYEFDFSDIVTKNAAKFSSYVFKQTDYEYFYEIRETVFKYSPTKHRNRQSIPQSSEVSACYCQWH